MYALIDRKTKSGKKKYQKIVGINKVVFFDDVKAKIEVLSDCTTREPIRPKDVDKYTDI